jgi:minor extracellular serine protease Vpr
VLGIYKITPLNSGGASDDAIAKALDDALADGMDVVNISFDSPFVVPLDQDLVATSIRRATELGMIVVVSAGNGGPDLASIEDLGSVPSAISVGASDSDRSLGAGNGARQLGRSRAGLRMNPVQVTGPWMNPMQLHACE